MGFSGGFGRVLGINCSEDNHSLPLGFSNQCFSFLGNNQSVSDGVNKNNSFLNELQKTIEMEESVGYNMDGCMDYVTQILKRHIKTKLDCVIDIKLIFWKYKKLS